MVKCIRCGQTWDSGDVCPTCGFIQSRAEEIILGWYEEAKRAEREKHYAVAAEYYMNAADMGLVPAQLAYGRMLESGRGVKRSLDKAGEYYAGAASYGDAEAAFCLCKLLRSMGKAAAEDADFWLRVAAALGWPDAQYELAEAYRNGKLPAPHETQVVYWYAESAKAGCVEAAVKAGELYLSGSVSGGTEGHAKWFFERVEQESRTAQRYLRRLKGIAAEEPPALMPVNHDAALCDLAQTAERKGDNAIAFALYSLATETGYPRAVYRLGLCYENGVGTSRMPSEAVRLYRAAAEGGSVDALLQLASCYRYGRGVEVDKQEALSYYTRAAEKQNARAQYILGECYLTDELTECNVRMANMWLEKAALQGHREALTRVRHLYDTMTEMYNTAVERQREGDYGEALRLYIMLADVGHSPSQCNAGFCYQTGKGCKKDAGKAFQYYLMAAEGGSAAALYNVALCYARGIGVQLDFGQARQFLARAVKAEYAPAGELLAQLDRQTAKKQAQRIYAVSTVAYRRGDVQECIRLLVYAAKMGNLRAMYMLGCHYEFGDGIECDMARANALYAACAQGGLDAYKNNLKSGYMRERKILALKNKR